MARMYMYVLAGQHHQFLIRLQPALDCPWSSKRSK